MMNKSQEYSTRAPVPIDRLWNIHFIKICIIGLLFSTAFYVFSTIFPLLMSARGANATLIGVATSWSTIISLATRLIVGPALDKQGRKKILLLGVIICMLSMVGFALFPTVLAVVAFRVLLSPGLAAVSSTNGTIVSDVVPQDQLVQGIAFFGIFFTISSAVGPALGLALIADNQFNTVIWTNFLLYTVILIFATTVNDPPRHQAAKSTSPGNIALNRATGQAPTRGIWKFLEKASLPSAYITAAHTFASTAATIFLVPFAMERGIESIGISFTVLAIASLIVRVFGGRLTIRHGLNAGLIPGTLLSIASLLVYAFMQNLTMLLVGSFMYGASIGFLYPVLNTLAISSASPSRRGVANSTYASAFDVGGGIGAIVWGVFADFAGYSTVFIGSALFMIFTLFLSMALTKGRTSY